MARRILYLYLIFSPFIMKANECTKLKTDIIKLGGDQLSLQNQGSPLIELQEQLAKAQAKLIILEGIKELKHQYIEFLSTSQEIEIDNQNIDKIDNFQKILKKGVVASKKISAVYNVFKHAELFQMNDGQQIQVTDILQACKRIGLSDKADGVKFCKIVQQSGPEQEEVLNTINGLMNVYRMAHGDDNEQEKKQALKEYIDNIDNDIPKQLLSVETIDKIETAKNTLDSVGSKFRKCLDEAQGKCFQHLVFGQQAVEEVQKLFSGTDESFKGKIFKTYMEENFGDLDGIYQSIDSIAGKTAKLNQDKKDLIEKIQQNYMISRQKRRIREAVYGRQASTLPSSERRIPEVRAIYREIFDELLEENSATCPNDPFSLDKLSSCLDAIIQSNNSDPDSFIDDLNNQLTQQKELVSDLSTRVASIMLGDDYKQIDEAKNFFAENLQTCSGFSQINCRRTDYNMRNGVLKPNNTFHRLLMDGHDIIGHLPVRKPAEETITRVQDLEDEYHGRTDNYCDHDIVGETDYCQRQGRKERARIREQRESDSQELHQNLSDLHRRHNILYEIAPDGDVRTRDLGKRRPWWQYPEVGGSLGMMGVMAVQGHFQNVIWEKTKASIIGEYKYAVAQSWWSRQSCVDTYIGLEYLCMPQGYAYNSPGGGDFGLFPQAAANFCEGCAFPQSSSLPAGQAVIP